MAAALVATLLFLVSVPAGAQSGATLGLATIGSVHDEFDSNYMTGSRVVNGTAAVSVSSVSVYVGAISASPNNQYSVAVYSDSGGSPAALVAQSATSTLTANAWNTAVVSASLSASAAYWLMFNANGASGFVDNMYFNADSTNVGVYVARSFGSWPTTFGGGTLATQRYSIYATMDVGTPTATPTPGPATATPTVTPTPGAPTATPTVTPTSTPTPAGAGSIIDPSIVWSPYTWRDGGTYRESNPQNASVELEFQSDSLSVDLDTAAYAGITVSDWPATAWSLDYGPWTSPVTANSGTNVGGTVRRVTIAGSLPAGVWHHVLLWTSSNGNQSHWTGLQQRVVRFSRTGGGALTSTRAPTYTSSHNLLVFGDSTSEFSGGDTWPAPGHFHWPIGVARALSANLGLIAYEGQGWRVPPTGGGAAFNTPGDAANQSWRWYSSGQSRLTAGVLTPAPDYVLASFGTNDQGGFSSTQVQAAASDWLVQVRTAAGPSAHIFVMVPFGQWFHANLTAAVAASGDTRVHLIDLGAEQSQGLTGLNTPFGSWRSADSEHPNADEQAEISARIVGAIRDALQGALP